MDPILSILRTYWKFPSFRPLQEEIIRSVLEGRDTLALLPTGGGKSLCFQVPALAKPGLCLVVSPLIALMKDQVAELRRKNITAFALYSGMSRKAVINTFELAANSNCKFLYVSPERLETDLFKEYLPSLPVNLVAVDEAHCVSQWGYDFRPVYLRISDLRAELPGIPILALTASATPDVQQDIADKLGLLNPTVFRQSFERPNLSYSVFGIRTEENSLGNKSNTMVAGKAAGKPREKVAGKIDKIIDIVQKVPGSSIVYCATRKTADRISDALQSRGVSATSYHAGLTREQRSERQEAWMKEQVRVIASTNAFGMGIDKAGVRTVIHADTPDSIEAYYQEAGRAGRDGKMAYAVLLYNEEELDYLQSLPEIRFPPIQTIRNVYQALMNHLRLPVSSGAGGYYEFDLAVFCKAFRLDRPAVSATLKTLEQEDLLTYLDQPYLPARVQLLVNRQTLDAFQAAHPDWKPLLDALMRNYEGIMDRPVVIYERQLASLLQRENSEIGRDLARLDSIRIIDYTPTREEPLICFQRDRVSAEDLYINPLDYQKRKERYQSRIRKMLEFVKMPEACRSRHLAVYFGDEKAGDCGICDNCLRRKKNSPPK